MSARVKKLPNFGIFRNFHNTSSIYEKRCKDKADMLNLFL